MSELSNEQQQMITQVIEGKSFSEAAAAIGVDLATVEEWQGDAEFVAALNRGRKALWGNSEDRLRALLPKALGAIEAAIQSDDLSLKAALAVVKIVGLGTHGVAEYGLLPMGDTEAADVEARWRRDENNRLLTRCL